jgi:hypothetical protein
LAKYPLTDAQKAAKAAAARKRYHANPEKAREASRRYKTNNRDKALANARANYRERYQKNPEKFLEKNKRYLSQHLDSMKVRSARRYQKAKALRNEIKLAAGCIDCGYKTHAAALHFDHVRGVKVASPAAIQSMPQLLAELEKCVVRCANCHAVRHANEREAKREQESE